MPKKNNPLKKPFEGTLAELVKYQPKGSYCNKCEHMLRNCQHLDFTTMPVLKDRPYLKLVQCTCFTPEDTQHG